MSDTIQELAKLIAKHRPARDGDGFPPWLRERVATYVVEQLRSGAAISSLRSELGISVTTLRRWTRQQPEPTPSRGFARVMLAQAPDTAALTTASTSHPTRYRSKSSDDDAEISLISPSGFVLRGLSFEQGLQALATLR